MGVFMKIINVSLSGTTMLPDTTMAGMAMDNLTTALNITLPDDWAGFRYRLKFRASNQSRGDAYITDILPAEDGRIVYWLPETIMVAGPLEIQLEASDATGKTVHTAVMQLHVVQSIGWLGSDPIPV